MHVRIRISFYSKQRKNYFIKYPPTLIELLPIFQVTGQQYGISLCSAEIVLALSGVASLTKLCPGSLSACTFFVKSISCADRWFGERSDRTSTSSYILSPENG